MASQRRPMWTCPGCGRTFANRNQTHTCRPLGRVEDHLEGKPERVVATYRAFEAAALALGTVDLLPESTRIAFHRRMSFAACTVRRTRVDAHIVLARRLDDPRFVLVQTFSPRNHLHAFRLTDPSEVDERVRAWLAAAYEVGGQRHLDR
jgi:uncharacterized protein DUF5655